MLFNYFRLMDQDYPLAIIRTNAEIDTCAEIIEELKHNQGGEPVHYDIDMFMEALDEEGYEIERVYTEDLDF